ncbi:hypothetical protein TRFO_26259 [Tritrichomonas foetus]|uniref:MatE family protein n=1 Tax=Tritrichomonas foetus TaxID=1144522 RepID=A0A1J4K381_9EUKA|nr:hypothetical protein TRFO_26259 [Tritrichomonas foetus]|eukprot:OHT05897.1 hypothetical protein TRFO_26259 [Tritrichomonas foetus]
MSSSGNEDDNQKEKSEEATLKMDESENDLLKALEEERKRFSSLKPLPTLLILSIGPLLTSVGTALHDSCDLLVISHAYGSYGVSVAGLSSLIRFFCVGVSLYFGYAATLKLSSLIGQNRQAEAKQVIADLFRFSILVSIPAAVVIYFITEPILIYMNCPPNIRKDSITYILPIIATLPTTVMLQLSMGVIQGEGRSLLCGLFQLGVFVLNCCVFAPIIEIAAKAPINWSGVPYTLAHGIPGIVLMVLIFQGKFSIKPTWSMWLRPFSREIWDALKVASSFIIFLIVNSFPPMLLMHYLLGSAASIGDLDVVNSSFNVLMKITAFVNAFTTGVSQGFMAAGSYSHGAREIHRFVKLAQWALLICLILQFIFIPIVVPKPWIVAKMWLNTPEEEYYSTKIDRIPFYTQFLNAVNEVTNCCCMSFGQGWAPYVPAILKGILTIVGTIAFYYTGKTDPVRIVYVYNVCDIAIFLVDIIFFFTIIRPYVKKEKALALKEGRTEINKEETYDEIYYG